MFRGSKFSLAWMALLALLPIVLIASGRMNTVIPAQGAFRDLLWVLPYFLFGAAGFLGLRAHQLPILFSSLLWAASYALTWRLRFPLTELQSFQIQAAAIAVPGSLFLISLPRSGKVFGRSGLNFISLTVLPWVILGALVFALPAPVRDEVLYHRTPFGDFWRVPFLGVFFILPLVLVLRLRRDRYLSEFQLALVLSLVSWLFLVNRTLAPSQGSLALLASAVTHSCIGLMLLYAVYRLYWSKVYIDELTGLPNRRALDEKLSCLDSGYSLAMADIDFFKKFNDSFGHEEGDNVLRYVAAHLDEATGARAYRYGGEEFCVVCESMSEAQVTELLEGTRAGLAARGFAIRAPAEKRAQTSKEDRRTARALAVQRVQITMSFGVAKFEAGMTTSHDVMQAADQLLYKAKEAGRNCVISSWKKSAARS